MKRKISSILSVLFTVLFILSGDVQFLHGSDSGHINKVSEHLPKPDFKTGSNTEYDKNLVFAELERAITIALENYSNVHRGKGQYSMVSTKLYEEARKIVRQYMGAGDDYEVIFGSAREIDILINNLKGTKDYKVLYSDRETGLRFCVAACAIKKESLPDIPPVVGGGEVDDVDDNTVTWSVPPDKFEAGTPNITGAILLAKAIGMMHELHDKDIFRNGPPQKKSKIAGIDPLANLSGRQLLLKLRETMVGRGEAVPSEEGMIGYINLDNGASTPTFEPIMRSALEALRITDEEAGKVVSETKTEVFSYFHAPETEYDCIFTLNTTESVNIASELAATFREEWLEPVVIGTDLEHNSNELPWRKNILIHVSVDRNGFIDLSMLEKLLKEYNTQKIHGNKKICIVTASGASNVLGTFNDIGSIANLAHKYGAYIHVDAAQLAAHREVDVGALGVDILSCSGHKMYAPFGTGCLVARKTLLQKFGEEKLQKIRIYGERNIIGIASLRTSMKLLKRIGLDVLEKEERELTARLLRGLAGISGKYGGDAVYVFGIQDPDRIDNKGPVVAFHVENIPHNIVAERLAEIRGIGVRTGCFCAHRLLKFLFDARGKDVSALVREGKEPGLIRVSIGLENTTEDIDEFLRTLDKIISDPDSKKYIPGDSNCRYCAGKSTVFHEISKEIDKFVEGIVHKVYYNDTERLVRKPQVVVE